MIPRKTNSVRDDFVYNEFIGLVFVILFSLLERSWGVVFRLLVRNDVFESFVDLLFLSEPMFPRFLAYSRRSPWKMFLFWWFPRFDVANEFFRERRTNLGVFVLVDRVVVDNLIHGHCSRFFVKLVGWELIRGEEDL